jgi:carbamoyl-phosphate synthase large subunit
MARIHIGGAGGAPSNNVIRSLRESGRGHYLIGASSVPSDLLLADVDEKHVVPNATSPDYRSCILALLARARPTFMHVQSDYEVLAVSRMRDEIASLGVGLFLPSQETIENCVDKEKSYAIWARAGFAGAADAAPEYAGRPEARLRHTRRQDLDPRDCRRRRPRRAADGQFRVRPCLD